MTTQAVDIFSMLNKAQSEYNQQQHNPGHNQSVAAFFQQASTNGQRNAPSRPMPVPIRSLNSLEQIERQIRTSPPSNHYQNGSLQPCQPSQTQENSPLAQFFNSTFNNQAPRPAVANAEVGMQKEKQNGNISAPPGFNNKVQPPRNAIKETKLITPTMFVQPNNVEKKPASAEPLTKNQLLQALNYLIQNDDEFMKKVHEAYIKSIKLAS